MKNLISGVRSAKFCLALMLAAGQMFADDVGSICGKVVRPGGKPAKDAEVNVYAGFWSRPKLIASTQTDKDGAFCLRQIAPGNYHIDAVSLTRSYTALCDMKEIELVSNLTLTFELKRYQCMMTGMPTYAEIKDPPMTKRWGTEELQNIPSRSVGGR